MKGAGSSWGSRKGLICILIKITLFILINIKYSSCTTPCTLPNTQDTTNYNGNLIEELSVASQENGKLENIVPGVSGRGSPLDSYDATPFWYNLIQAITIASGISPTNEILLHDLVTTSFQGERLDGAIKNILSLMKCNQNFSSIHEQQMKGDVREDAVPIEQEDRTLQDTPEHLQGKEEEILDQYQVVDDLQGKEEEMLDQYRQGSLVDDSSDRMIDDVDGGEYLNIFQDLLQQEKIHPRTGNSLKGVRRRRRRRRVDAAAAAAADLHQPFFMSEIIPSSLVTRHPSIISISGCPSGHIQDLRGACRQIFQYTINYGSLLNNNNYNYGARPLTSGGLRTSAWPFRRVPQRPAISSTRGGSSSIRDIVRGSSLYRQSALRGYVPPFIYRNSMSGPSHARGRSDTENERMLPLMDLSITPSPRLMALAVPPSPQIVIMGSADGTRPPVVISVLQPKEILQTNGDTGDVGGRVVSGSSSNGGRSISTGGSNISRSSNNKSKNKAGDNGDDNDNTQDSVDVNSDSDDSYSSNNKGDGGSDEDIVKLLEKYHQKSGETFHHGHYHSTTTQSSNDDDD